MNEYLVVDGYNIINAWDDLKEQSISSLESARLKLIDIMSEYRAYKEIIVIVVFDAHYVKNSQEKHEYHNGVEVVFTKEFESADSYIERTVASMPVNYNVKVATSDWAEQTLVLGLGAARVSASELEEEIAEMKKSMDKKYLRKNTYDKNLLEHSLNPDIVTKLEKLRRNNDKA